MNEEVFTTIGASNHSKYPREKDDFYVTPPETIDFLHNYNLLDKGNYWEPACGNGSLSNRLIELGYNVISTDLFDRGYGKTNIDFLDQITPYENIITNPPYSIANDFVEHAIELTENKLYIFAKLTFLETIKRYNKIFKNNPPQLVCPFVKRINCKKHNNPSKHNSAIAYAWYIWDKTNTNQETKVKWLI